MSTQHSHSKMMLDDSKRYPFVDIYTVFIYVQAFPRAGSIHWDWTESFYQTSQRYLLQFIKEFSESSHFPEIRRGITFHQGIFWEPTLYTEIEQEAFIQLPIAICLHFIKESSDNPLFPQRWMEVSLSTKAFLWAAVSTEVKQDAFTQFPIDNC